VPTASEIEPRADRVGAELGPTVRSSTTVSGAGSAPARSSTAEVVGAAHGRSCR
jgi:hypothetical protein